MVFWWHDGFFAILLRCICFMTFLHDVCFCLRVLCFVTLLRILGVFVCVCDTNA